MDHTPGPWKTAPCSGGGLILVRPNSGQISLQIFPAADARLIAAAPDLLAALKDWLEGHEDACRRAIGDTGGCPTCPDIRAAIARAEGA